MDGVSLGPPRSLAGPTQKKRYKMTRKELNKNKGSKPGSILINLNSPTIYTHRKVADGDSWVGDVASPLAGYPTINEAAENLVARAPLLTNKQRCARATTFNK